MAKDKQVVLIRESLKALQLNWHGLDRDEHCAFDTRGGEFLWLADVNQDCLFRVDKPCLGFVRV